MKLTIDFDNKVIKVESSSKLSTLFEVLNNMFPNETWKEYTIDTNTTIVYGTYPTYYTYKSYEWPITLCSTTNGAVGSSAGIQHFDCN